MLTRNATQTSPSSNNTTDQRTVAEVSPPAKRARKSVCKYSIIHLKGGRGYQYFQDKASSESFVAAFHDVVEEIKENPSKKAFLEAKQDCETNAAIAKIASKDPEQTSRRSDEQSNLARNILESMKHRGTANIDTIRAYILTGTWYTKACIIIRFLNSNGKEHWCWNVNPGSGRPAPSIRHSILLCAHGAAGRLPTSYLLTRNPCTPTE
jgi:hypothetical protein